MMNRTTIAPGVSLTTVEADKFNTCRVSIYFVRPAKRETATVKDAFQQEAASSHVDDQQRFHSNKIVTP